MAAINYTPPPTLKAFIRDHITGTLFYDWVIGPVGSGKTTAIFFKLVRMAKLQERGADGIRRSRAVIVRNTMPQLKDTTIKSWDYWFKEGVAGSWAKTDKTFTLRFDDVECEVMFRALDTADDVSRVLSLEVTFAILDEFVEIPKAIIEALSARCGRYPNPAMGGATNWGMWGSSNPSTEDNWWYDYLHDPKTVEMWSPETQMDPDARRMAFEMKVDRRNVRYFHQPSGLGPDAENIDNLPGGRDYYEAQINGKTEAWVKQYIESEWGYSTAGKPVVPSFRSELHVSKSPLEFNPYDPVVFGLDPGLGGTAAIFGQEDLHGRLLVFGELIEVGMGASRFIRERLLPYIKRRFPDAQLMCAPDPAAGNRAQTDEKTVVDEIKRHFPVKIETNNRLPLRLDAIDHYATRLTGAGPALLIDGPRCPVLVRALKGGWRFGASKDPAGIKSPEPEKNQYSHPGDAFGYLARFYHRQDLRNARYTGGSKPFVPPRRFGSGYHAR